MQHYSLNGLRMFDTAARLLNFTSAAEALHVSQAAVSQQIRRLETELNVTLFHRDTHGLRLTAEGETLAAATRKAMHLLETAIDDIAGGDAKGVLTISTLPSLATKWLNARLDGFRQTYPEIELYIHTSGDKTRFDEDGVDAAIRMCPKAEDGLVDTFLMPDQLCLVATPTLAKQIGEDLDNLYAVPLILDDSKLISAHGVDLTNVAAMQALELMGLNQSRLHITTYKQSDNVVIAALAGRGTALARRTLCEQDLAAGRLTLIREFETEQKLYYSLVYPKHQRGNPKLRLFDRWLREEIARSQASAAQQQVR